MADDLNPCPFCGPHDYFKPELIYRGPEGHHDIVCPQCGAKKWCEVWERRPVEDALRAEVEQWKSKAIAQEDYSREVIELRAEVARLKAELARYKEPLTDEQVLKISYECTTQEVRMWDIVIRDVRAEAIFDAAIRAAREGK